MGIAVAAGGVLMLLVGVGLVLTSKPAANANAPAHANSVAVQNPSAATTPMNLTQQPATSTSTIPTVGIGAADPAPMVRKPGEKVEPPKPEPVASQVAATTTTPVNPVPLQKQTPPGDDGLQAFKTELASATALLASEKFSMALDIVTRLKASSAQAQWWAGQKQACDDLEKRIQEQSAELATEADDIRKQVAKSDKPEFLDKIEAIWKSRAAGSTSPDGWTLLDPMALTAANGTTLTKQPDGSVLATGATPDQEVFSITTQPNLSGITAFRVDALPDPSLPGGGPGRSSNYVLTEFTVQVVGANGGAPRPVTFAKVNADYSQNDWNINNTIDGNPGTGWAIANEMGKPHTAVYETNAPIVDSGGVRLICNLEFKSGVAKHTIGKFRLSATTAKIPQSAAAALPTTPSAQPPADTLLAGPARGVLKAIAESRARLADQAKQKRIAEIATRLDALERLIKSRPRVADPIFKTLDELEGMIALDEDVIEKFGERIGGMRFEASSARDGDLALYRATVRMNGNGAELHYDFATLDEFNAWGWDNPNNAGTAEHDIKKGAVILKSSQRHNWDGKDRRGMAVFKLPFHFRPDFWLLETEVSLLSDQNKGAKPDIGILAWDGGTNVVRLSVQEAGARGVHMIYSASTPKKENFTARPVALNAKIKDTIRLQLSCSGGMVGCVAINAAGASVTGPKEPLGFEPKFIGLFIRNSDDGENSSAMFQSVKIQGVPNTEKLKELRDGQRIVASSSEKIELIKRHASLALLNEGQLVPLSLEKVATIPSTRRMFLGATDEERLLFPTWGAQTAQTIPFIVADPKGDTVNNVILLNGPQGKVSATMPQSVSLPVNSTAGAIHLLGGINGWGFPVSERGSTSMIVRLMYDDGQVEEHRLLNGVHFSDYLKVVDVPDSKLAFKLGEQQMRYIALKTMRPSSVIKTIEFAKGDDKTAPIIAAVTLDKRVNVTSIPFSNTSSRLTAPGKVGKAFVCNGREFFETPHTAELEPAQMTVEAWIYIDAYPTGDQRRWIVNKNTNEGMNGHYALMINGANVGAYMNINQDFSVWSNGGLQLKQWQHLAMSYDGATLKAYLNGAQVAATSVNRARTPSNNTSLVIGRRQDGNALFTGLIDEVRIYNRVLPDDEIKAQVQNPAAASKDGLVGYWGFD